MADSVPNMPKMFSVNWFRQDEAGRYIWPGFGTNIHAIRWISERVSGHVDVVETPVGKLPLRSDLDLEGVDITEEALELLLSIDPVEWHAEVEAINDYFASLGTGVPTELVERLSTIKTMLA